MVLVIIDNYVDGTVFQLLANVTSGVLVKILAFSMKPDFAHEARRFQQQYKIPIEIRQKRGDFHDRFIILDFTKAYHLGASIKGLGSRAAMIHLIEDPDNVSALRTTQMNAWDTAHQVVL